MVDTTNEWILQRVGISQRHIAPPGMATSDMAVEAAIALRQRGIDGSEMDAILVCTVTPDMMFPSTACLVQDRLGAKGAWGFDLVAACSGFVYGLTTAAHLVSAGSHKKVLVIGADTMSRIIDYTDRSTCVLFGDGAGAMLVEPAEEGERLHRFPERNRRLRRRLFEEAGRRQPHARQRRDRRPTPALRQTGRPAGFQIRGAQDVRMLPRSAGAPWSDGPTCQ